MARIVADADVLAADLLVGGPSRAALDVVRGHSWTDLVATEPLLDDATSVIGELGDDELADDWRGAVEGLATVVEQRPGDHPALAAAERGEARHVLSLDEGLLTASAGASIRSRVETSVKHPAGFVRLFDPESVHAEVVGGDYPGPDGRSRD